jgi:streptogramin lyase
MKMVRQVLLAVGLVLCASTSFAVHNLKQPAGLAVDSAGNLYVANYGLNEILIYSPNYVQLVSRTITQNISGPEDVAFDPYGNLWVANFNGNSNGSSGYITEYTAGVQNTSATVNNGISGPLYLSFDGLNNLWVLNNGANITIYDPPFALNPPSNLARTLTTNAKTFKVSAGVIVSGTRSKTDIDSSSLVFQGTVAIGSEDELSSGAGVTAIAADSSGNTYMCDPTGNVRVLDGSGNVTVFVTLGFAARGMAVDNRNKRLYASNESGQEIAVYSTTNAELLTTIGNR